MTSTQTQDKALAPSGPVKNKRELKDWLQGEVFQRELATLLPRTMSPERFVRIAFQAIYRNPDLLKCNQESFFNCLLQLGSMGLEPDGRNAHLIPFKDECTLIVDYKGIAEILRRNRDVASLHCDVVYSADQYEAEQGTNQHLMHKKAQQGNRGTPILAYSFVRLADGSQEFEEMSIAEIEAIRKRSKTPHKGPWVTDFNEMAKKTVFRRHAKTLPLSPASRDALERDQDGDSLAEAVQVVNASVVAAERKRFRGSRALEAESETDQENDSEMAPKRASEPAQGFSGTGKAESKDEAGKAILGHLELVETLLDRLQKSGFAEAELLAIMKLVRLAPPEADKLAGCENVHLQMVVDEWENAELRMREARTQAKKA